MIGFVVRSFVLVQLLALELIAAGRLGGLAPDLSCVFLVYAALHLRARSAVLLVLLLAIPRSLLQPGSFQAHVWMLCGVWILLRTMSSYVFSERWYWQMILAAVAATSLLLGQAWLFSTTGEDPLERGLVAVALTALITPGLLLLFPFFARGLRRREERPVRTEAIS